MRCRNVKPELNRHLDGELSAEERGHVERHLQRCGSCREALERLRAAEAALTQLPVPPEVPGGFTERVMACAARRPQRRPVVVSFWRSLSPAMRVAAVAMLMLGLCLGALMSLGLSGDPGRRPGLQAADPDAVYGLDYLSDAPAGSLADAYLRLASAHNGGGQ